MMKGTKKISGLVFIALMLAFAVSAFAQPGFQHRPEGAGHGMFKMKMHGFGGIERFAEELGLTEEQIDKLKALKFEAAKEAIAKRSEVKIAHVELRELMQADKADEAAIKKQVEKVGRLKTDMMLAMVDKKLTVKKILTDEQQNKLKELRKERFKDFRRGEGKGRRGFGFNEEMFEGEFWGGLDEAEPFDQFDGQEL